MMSAEADSTITMADQRNNDSPSQDNSQPQSASTSSNNQGKRKRKITLKSRKNLAPISICCCGNDELYSDDTRIVGKIQYNHLKEIVL